MSEGSSSGPGDGGVTGHTSQATTASGGGRGEPPELSEEQLELLATRIAAKMAGKSTASTLQVLDDKTYIEEPMTLHQKTFGTLVVGDMDGRVEQHHALASYETKIREMTVWLKNVWAASDLGELPSMMEKLRKRVSYRCRGIRLAWTEKGDLPLALKTCTTESLEDRELLPPEVAAYRQASDKKRKAGSEPGKGKANKKPRPGGKPQQSSGLAALVQKEVAKMLKQSKTN